MNLEQTTVPSPKRSADLLTDLGLTTYRLKPNFQTINEIDNPNPHSMEANVTANQTKHWHLIGAGLQALQQTPTNPAYQLWQAIADYHYNGLQQVTAYDSSRLRTEEDMFDLLDQLAEQGIEMIYSMDPDHPINEILAENIQLIPLPSLEAMLDQPDLKRVCYQTLLAHNTQ